VNDLVVVRSLSLTQTKLAAFVVSPTPLYSAPCGKGQSGGERDALLLNDIVVVSGDDLVRRGPVLDPIIQRGQRIEDIRTRAARTVKLTGDHEQAARLQGFPEGGRGIGMWI
jgi:hypothetical protein